MNRTLSVIRRRANIVDTLVPFVYGVAGYRLKWAANFDAAVWTTFLTATNVGYLDPVVNPVVIEAQPTSGRVRIVFDPATYSIPDTKSFWLELFHVAAGGAETQISAPSLILPDSAHHGIHQVTIHGDAPNAADSTGSLQLDLPRLMGDFRIHVETVDRNLYVATEQDGAEQQLRPDTFPQSSNFSSTQGSLWVRGGGAVVTFSAIFTTAFPK